MIYSIEKAISGRSQCRECLQNIKKGSLRGLEEYSFGGLDSTRFYCADCSERKLREDIEKMEELLEELKRSKT